MVCVSILYNSDKLVAKISKEKHKEMERWRRMMEWWDSSALNAAATFFYMYEEKKSRKRNFSIIYSTIKLIYQFFASVSSSKEPCHREVTQKQDEI